MDAKAITSEERAKAYNTLHAVGRMMANLDMFQDLHFVTAATEPFTLAHGLMARDMRSAEQSATQYAQWAMWSWLDTLKSCVRTARSWGDLAKGGPHV